MKIDILFCAGFPELADVVDELATRSARTGGASPDARA